MNITQTKPGRYAVTGDTGNQYQVQYLGRDTAEWWENDAWACSCPAFLHRHGPCKHIKAIREGNVEQDTTALTAPSMTPMAMLEKAISVNANIETLERLMALQERWQANQARQAFTAALARVREELPNIMKNQTVDFTSSKGRTHYQYEDLPSITKAVSPILARHDMSFRWRPNQAKDGYVSITCIISHKDGYEEEATLSGPYDTSGNKNPLQTLGSATCYLQRYTLKCALGLAAGVDDDGRQGAPVTGTAPAGAQDAEWHEDTAQQPMEIRPEMVYTGKITDIKTGKSAKGKPWTKAVVTCDNGIVASGFINEKDIFKEALEPGPEIKTMGDCKGRRVAVRLEVDGKYTNVTAWMPWDERHWQEQPFGDGEPEPYVPPSDDSTDEPDPCEQEHIAIREILEPLAPSIREEKEQELERIKTEEPGNLLAAQAFRAALQQKVEGYPNTARKEG